MGYRLTFENEVYNQYKLRMIHSPDPYIKLLHTAKLTNPPFQKRYQSVEMNTFKEKKVNHSFSEITGKGRFINEYI
ncbi:hypothetical protein J6TS2_03420 [Heyndrickxia sporothermodurans]|nr:hypothetical protein J6TS2_03420 [Heyndrickxia sporothermodurans]